MYWPGFWENNKDRVVRYQIKNDLVTPDALARMKSGQNYIKNSVAGVNELLPMPADYYSLSNSEEMLIRKGSHAEPLLSMRILLNFFLIRRH